MDRARYLIDADDPRAPSQELWDRMSAEERREVLDDLPSEFPVAEPPQGDPHRISKTSSLEALDEYFRRTRRRVYMSAELPVYYPGERMFAPDLIAVLDVEPHLRQSWVVSHEKRGLDFVLEIHVAGKRQKDFKDNVERYARLGIPEYFAFDPIRRRLAGWRSAGGDKPHEAIPPREGRWESRVLELDLSVEEGRLRFSKGSAPLLDARELITKLSAMVDDAAHRADAGTRRAEEEARRAQEEARRAQEEARRAQEEARRADRLAARLRELGFDPDQV